MRLHTLSGKIFLSDGFGFGQIKIGFGDVAIFDRTRSKGVWQLSGQIFFKGKAYIGHGCKISIGKYGRLEIGDNFMITAESQIVCNKKISFGNNCLISWDCLIMDTDFHKIFDENDLQLNEDNSIHISNNVWIGCRNLVLKGSIIPENSILGANSTLNRDISSESGLYVGSPAKIIKKNIYWEV